MSDFDGGGGGRREGEGGKGEIKVESEGERGEGREGGREGWMEEGRECRDERVERGAGCDAGSIREEGVVTSQQVREHSK
jgi:hypothetical protein